jgi:DnaK suppressor protein
LKRKGGASKGKPKTKKHPKKPAKRASSKASTKAGKKKPKRKAVKSVRRKASGSGGSKPIGRKGRPASSRKTLKPKGLKAGTGTRAEQLRSMLEAKRFEIMEEIRRARQDGIESDRTSFPEVGDLVSASVEKERAFEYGEIGINALREIDNALEKLKSGTYGICELCKRPIGLRRLRVMPSARLCIACKSQEEASGK